MSNKEKKFFSPFRNFKSIFFDTPLQWACWPSERERDYDRQEQEKILKAEQKYLKLFLCLPWSLKMKYEILGAFKKGKIKTPVTMVHKPFYTLYFILQFLLGRIMLLSLF